MNQWKLDRRIREVAQSGEIPCPEDYSERMRNLCDNLPEEKEIPQKTGRYRLQFGMLCTAICVALAAAPVSAEVQKYHQRLESMQKEDRERYVSGVQESEANGDTYSRNLTDSELERMWRLTQSYEAGDAYPVGDVICIEGESQWKGNQVCFLTDISTFFLPVRELTDEEMLEIIDFHYKRDYSLAESQQETTEAPTPMTEEGQMRRAVELSRDYIQQMYQIELNQKEWKVETEMEETEMRKNDWYSVRYTNRDNQAEYEMVFNARTWRFSWIQCEYDGKKENVGSDVSIPSSRELRELYDKIKGVAEEMGCVSEVNKAYTEYIKSEGKKMKHGVEIFLMEEKDGSGWGAKYSLHSQQVYELFHLDDVNSYRKDRRTEYGSARVEIRLDDPKDRLP